MAAAGGFFLANGKDERAIQRQGGDRGAARGGQRDEVFLISAEVVRPGLRARVKERRFFAGLGIDRRLIGPLPQ